jgi:predicted nucleotide-binding protein (sugar kinase/HSP70/actin superfamily)
MGKKKFLLDYPIFTDEMRKTHTVLIPSFMDSHMELFAGAFERKGYKTRLLDNCDTLLVREGLKYVHNDTCYPATCVIGQFLDALKKEEDLEHVALILTQTGGGCRATNYVPLLRKALASAGFGHIPVITFNLGDLKRSEGLKINLSFLFDLLAAVTYGDTLMYLHNKTRSYEKVKGSSDGLVKKWNKKLREELRLGKASSIRAIKKNLRGITEDFNNLDIEYTVKPKVGIVGEIYVKYAAIGNNNLEEFLVSQGAEILVPGVFGFLMYCFANAEYDYRYYRTRISHKLYSSAILWLISRYEGWMIKAIKKYSKFEAMQPFKATRKEAKGIIKHGAKMGEGWLLSAEMNELIKIGYSNIICAQPFGCLPNHICGKGVMNRLKKLHPHANITPIDYDSSASKVNQENRIKLMLALAKEKIEE